MSLLDIIFSIVQAMLILFIALLVIPMISEKVRKPEKAKRNQTGFTYLDEYKRNMKK